MTLLRVTRSGGFAGLGTSVEVDVDDAAELVAAARAAAAAAGSGVADAYVYELDAAGESAVVGELALPAPLRERLDGVLRGARG